MWFRCGQRWPFRPPVPDGALRTHRGGDGLRTLSYTGFIDDRQPSVDHSIAAILGSNRDGSASAESSRALLTTVLGEFVLPSGGSVWTRTLLTTMQGLGVAPKAARQSMARMHERDWLTKEKVGRQTRWTLTEGAASLLTSGAERIYGFGGGHDTWDGRWLVLLASVPERERRLRYRMTVGLRWAGFGSLGQGVWLSPLSLIHI